MLVCHCNRVGNRAICAGTRCGACRPTIGALLNEQRAPEPRFFKVIVEPVALSQAS